MHALKTGLLRCLVVALVIVALSACSGGDVDAAGEGDLAMVDDGSLAPTTLPPTTLSSTTLSPTTQPLTTPPPTTQSTSVGDTTGSSGVDACDTITKALEAAAAGDIDMASTLLAPLVFSPPEDATLQAEVAAVAQSGQAGDYTVALEALKRAGSRCAEMADQDS